MKSLSRLDSATALKTFFHMERAITIACAAWVPVVARMETKAELARTSWESSRTAEALRQRVFELRYPERDLAVDETANAIAAFESVLHAPAPRSFLRATGEVLCGVLERAYLAYLDSSDVIADGPTFRFLRQAIQEKHRQRKTLARAIPYEQSNEDGWYEEFASVFREPMQDLTAVGPTPESRSRYAIPDDPGRDPRYFPCTFYWPDNFDPDHPYGDGLRLKVRSAVSHINEVWATDTAGAILYAFADGLGWDFVLDAARWVYDESRHMTMGQRRLRAWRIPDKEVPLGKYIYQAAAGQGPLHLLGMLAYFETKNIGKKVERAEEFGRLGDELSKRDMEFDWADEAIHAGYGRTWLRRAVELEGRDAGAWDEVVKECEELVATKVAQATDEEKSTIRAQAERVMELASKGTA
ncbi:MAG: hypothetical protein QOG54_2769 [Actinomycetota bacterium]|jgi:hypothetical protein|nr:hypothetical protein [Actinomycetota bacterium]